jgi:uncharacterized membrane protein
MGEYQRSITINASRKQIEDFVSDFSNLPKYVPTTKSAQPQQGDRVRVQGESPNGHKYDADGYFRLNESKNRLEWGSDGENQYSGWLEFKGDNTEAPSQVTVHISLVPPPQMEKGMSKTAGGPDQAINDGIQRSLESIKNLLEGKGGKVDYK